MSEIESAEVWSDLRYDVLESVETELSRQKSQGISPLFHVGAAGSVLVGAAFPRDSDTPDVLQWKGRLACIREVQDALSGLESYQFQGLCRDVLAWIGMEPTDCGPPGRDGGLDFFGICRSVPLDSDLTCLLFEKGVKVFGQAKLYKKPVGQSEVAKFAMDVRRFNAGRGRAFKLAPNWFKEASGKLQPVMFVIPSLTGDAREECEREGIASRESLWIAFQVVRHQESWFRYSDGHCTFSPKDMLEYYRCTASSRRG